MPGAASRSSLSSHAGRQRQALGSSAQSFPLLNRTQSRLTCAFVRPSRITTRPPPRVRTWRTTWHDASPLRRPLGHEPAHESGQSRQVIKRSARRSRRRFPRPTRPVSPARFLLRSRKRRPSVLCYLNEIREPRAEFCPRVALPSENIEAKIDLSGRLTKAQSLPKTHITTATERLCLEMVSGVPARLGSFAATPPSGTDDAVDSDRYVDSAL